MSGIEFIKDYKNIEKYRLSFNELAQRTFGIDFEKYYQKGCWTDRYICYSFIHNDKIIANLSINVMDIMINQQVYAAIQIGTVMTDPEYRNQGLSRRLMEIVMDEYKHRCSFMYLYANGSVLDFYPKFGFREVKDPTITMDLVSKNAASMKIRKLNIHCEDDWIKLRKFHSSRIPISQKCGVLQSDGIFSWYCLNIFYNDIYLVEDLDVILVFQKENDHLHLYDVVTQRQIKIKELLEILPLEDINRIVFHFELDEKDIEIDRNDLKQDDTLFVKTFEPLKDDILLAMKLPKIAQA